MLNRNFDHLSTPAHHFSEREDIRQKLDTIDQCNISSWEVWMQIELVNLLASMGHEWWCERTLTCDLRKNPQRLSVRADLLLRKEGWTQDSCVVPELRQDQGPTSCVRNMIADLAKGVRIKRSELELRSFWTLGVMPCIDKERLGELIDCYLNEKYYLIKSCKKHTLLRDIEHTPYCYTVI